MMKLKLDENIDAWLAGSLRDAGHDVATVKKQRLGGSVDSALLRICAAEDRILITLDLDFANAVLYPPSETAGLIVLRGPNQLFITMRLLFATLVQALETESPQRRLWIIELGRLRIHQQD